MSGIRRQNSRSPSPSSRGRQRQRTASSSSEEGSIVSIPSMGNIARLSISSDESLKSSEINEILGDIIESSVMDPRRRVPLSHPSSYSTLDLGRFSSSEETKEGRETDACLQKCRENSSNSSEQIEEFEGVLRLKHGDLWQTAFPDGEINKDKTWIKRVGTLVRKDSVFQKLIQDHGTEAWEVMKEYNSRDFEVRAQETLLKITNAFSMNLSEKNLSEKEKAFLQVCQNTMGDNEQTKEKLAEFEKMLRSGYRGLWQTAFPDGKITQGKTWFEHLNTFINQNKEVQGLIQEHGNDVWEVLKQKNNRSFEQDVMKQRILNELSAKFNCTPPLALQKPLSPLSAEKRQYLGNLTPHLLLDNSGDEKYDEIEVALRSEQGAFWLSMPLDTVIDKVSSRSIKFLNYWINSSEELREMIKKDPETTLQIISEYTPIEQKKNQILEAIKTALS